MPAWHWQAGAGSGRRRHALLLPVNQCWATMDRAAWWVLFRILFCMPVRESACPVHTTTGWQQGRRHGGPPPRTASPSHAPPPFRAYNRQANCSIPGIPPLNTLDSASLHANCFPACLPACLQVPTSSRRRAAAAADSGSWRQDTLVHRHPRRPR